MKVETVCELCHTFNYTVIRKKAVRYLDYVQIVQHRTGFYGRFTFYMYHEVHIC